MKHVSVADMLLARADWRARVAKPDEKQAARRRYLDTLKRRLELAERGRVGQGKR
ncbi:hypothetical protein [Chromobacterium amazonense]|uniref:hypothetical protein n=1 Tax=Chromobacterium amazonense TaxID=1382803 RepID=UPI0016712F4D|nr:hypothetical protein [Chromobacterium amazonense]